MQRIVEFIIVGGKENTCGFCGAKHYGNFTHVTDMHTKEVIFVFCDGCRFAIQDSGLVEITNSAGSRPRPYPKLSSAKAKAE